MVFNDTSNTHDSLVHYANFLLGNISNSEYSLADKARATNTWKYRVATWIWKNEDAWDFDDSSRSTFPIATGALSDGQQDYALPTGAIRIIEVEILLPDGVTYVKLDPIDESNLSVGLSEYLRTSGTPRQYRLFKQSCFLYPKPATGSVTMAAGIRFRFEREIVEFTSATTATEIGMGEPYDRAVAVGCALEFAVARGMPMSNNLSAMLFGGIINGLPVQGLKTEIEQLVSSRTRGMKPKIRIPYETFE